MIRRIHQPVAKQGLAPTGRQELRNIRFPGACLPFSKGCCSFRSGSLLVELLVAGALLGVVTAAVIPTLAWIVRQRKFNHERQAAILEVGNVMERLMTLDWNELTSERAAQVKLSEPVENQLADPRLTVTVDTEDDAAKHVLIELSWQIGPGRAAPPVRLAAWVYRQ